MQESEQALASSALPAVLDAIETPLFVMHTDRGVRYASAAGRARLDRDPSAVEAELRAILTGARTQGGWTRRELALDGWFVLTPQNDGSAEPCVERASLRFGFTPRQREVVQLVVGGKTNDTIARLLAITPRTVEVHLSSIFDRAGVENRTSLAALVLTS